MSGIPGSLGIGKKLLHPNWIKIWRHDMAVMHFLKATMRGHQNGRHGLEAFPEAVSIFYDVYDMKYVNPGFNVNP